MTPKDNSLSKRIFAVVRKSEIVNLQKPPFVRWATITLIFKSSNFFLDKICKCNYNICDFQTLSKSTKVSSEWIKADKHKNN
jgi:hypothetical protein